jgi:hypothetical protein
MREPELARAYNEEGEDNVPRAGRLRRALERR